MDIGVGNNEGTLDDDTRAIHKRIQTCWNSEERFEIIFAQVIMAPLGRRLASPHAEPRLCPWRKTILLTERDTVRVEEWMKIYGIGSVDNKEERYSRERETLGFFLSAGSQRSSESGERMALFSAKSATHPGKHASRTQRFREWERVLGLCINYRSLED